jgi:hypothetical protein
MLLTVPAVLNQRKLLLSHMKTRASTEEPMEEGTGTDSEEQMDIK